MSNLIFSLVSPVISAAAEAAPASKNNKDINRTEFIISLVLILTHPRVFIVYKVGNTFKLKKNVFFHFSYFLVGPSNQSKNEKINFL